MLYQEVQFNTLVQKGQEGRMKIPGGGRRTGLLTFRYTVYIPQVTLLIHDFHLIMFVFDISVQLLTVIGC